MLQLEDCVVFPALPLVEVAEGCPLGPVLCPFRFHFGCCFSIFRGLSWFGIFLAAHLGRHTVVSPFNEHRLPNGYAVANWYDRYFMPAYSVSRYRFSDASGEIGTCKIKHGVDPMTVPWRRQIESDVEGGRGRQVVRARSMNANFHQWKRSKDSPIQYWSRFEASSTEFWPMRTQIRRHRFELRTSKHLVLNSGQ